MGKNYVENLVDELKEIDLNNEEKVEKTLANFYQSNKANASSNSSKNKSLNILKMNSLEKKEYMIDEETKVVFDSIDGFGIMTIITETDDDAKNQQVIMRKPSREYKNREHYKMLIFNRISSTFENCKIYLSTIY